jgi:hypothetical protein
LLVPVVAVKIGTTGYRFARYYRGTPAYAAKGPPPIILRLAGPMVVASTVALFATGIAAIAVGRSSRWILEAHKASFIVWFGLMTVHVLGHAIETPALAVADWRNEHPRLHGAAVRRGLLIGSLAVGIGLGFFALRWIGPWQHSVGRR